MVRFLMIGMLLAGASVLTPSLASAQGAMKASDTTASGEDPNDKSQMDRTFEETRKHMMLHSEWSKKTGKMNDK